MCVFVCVVCVCVCCVCVFDLFVSCFIHCAQAGSQPTAQVPVQVLKPNELFYSKIIPLLKEKGMSEQTPRKDWPHAVQYRVLTELMKETPRDLLAKYGMHVPLLLHLFICLLLLLLVGSYGVPVPVRRSGGVSHRHTAAPLLSCV